jgi:integrase
MREAFSRGEIKSTEAASVGGGAMIQRASGIRLFDPLAGDDFAALPLRGVFEQWFLPCVLADPLERSRPVSPATLSLYREALGWWERSTRNPAAGEIRDVDAVAFLKGLAEIKYRRSRLAPERSLAPATRAKHVAAVRAILSRLVSDGRSTGLSLDLLESRVRLRKPRVDFLPKPTPPADLLFRICEGLKIGAGEFRKIDLPAPVGSRPAAWWRAFLGTLYAHGWRVQTALGLRRDFLRLEAEAWRLRVPGEAVGKTGKAAIRPAPDWLRRLWDAAAVEGPYLLGSPCGPGWLLDRWQLLQRAAGLEAAGVYSLHSLRRLHSVELGRVGFDVASSLSRDALQHSDGATTRAHYADLIEMAVLRLRPIE